MHLFREKGYEATSLKDLERVTGLKPGSLYNSFESKEVLFCKALEHYNAIIVQPRINMYLKAHAGIAGFEALFLSTLEEPDGRTLGCLLTNTAIEFGPLDSGFTERVHTGFGLLEAAFIEHIEQAQKEKLVSNIVPPAQLALQLLLFYQGLLVLIRSGRNKSELSKQIKNYLSQFK